MVYLYKVGDLNIFCIFFDTHLTRASDWHLPKKEDCWKHLIVEGCELIISTSELIISTPSEVKWFEFQNFLD